MASNVHSSFKKRSSGVNNSINGTKPSLHNSQLLISSGVPSFDYFIGGGIPVGCLLLINEDDYGSYAKYIFKYFLAEGIVSRHALYVCSENANCEEVIKNLPCPVDSDIEEDTEVSENSTKMTIAWRYENLKTVSFSPGAHKHFGHYFDLSRVMNEKILSSSSITYWPGKEGTTGESFQDTKYWHLLESIKGVLEKEKCFAHQTSTKRNILRIGLHCINSPLWEYDSNDDSSQNSVYFLTFLYTLRALIRNAFAVCVVTLPLNKFKKDFEQLVHLSDIAIQLDAFNNIKIDNLAPYKDYHGFLTIHKMAAVNSLISHKFQSTNLAFKLRRKKFVIEEFSLPPELEESTEREQDDSSVLTCSSVKSNKLDF